MGGVTHGVQGTTPGSTVSIGSVGNERTLTNLAAGRVTATSTDAVNGSELYATNQAVDSLTSGTVGPFVSNNSVTSTQPVSSGANAAAGGFGATASGAASLVVGNQSTDNGVANSTVLGQGASIASGVTGSNVALGQGSSVTSAAVPTGSGVINGSTVIYAGGAPAGVVSVGTAAAPRQLTNVAAGRVNASSTDAVNGSQLFAADAAIDTIGGQVTNLGNTVASSLGGGTTYNSTTGALTTNLSYGGNTYSSVQNLITAITGGGSAPGIKYFHANSTAPDSQALGTDSIAIGPNAVATNANDVALGSGSQTGTATPTASTTINGTVYSFAGTNPTSVVSVGALGAERQIQNVAAGTLSASSTDAVNGSQLYQTNQAVDSLATTVAADKTHYYSVNDGGTQGANYNNNGATGLNSLAAGVAAAASGASSFAGGNGASTLADNAVALGALSSASVVGGVAIGSGSVSDRAVLSGVGSIANGSHSIPFNTADQTLLGAVSFGSASANTYRQLTNVADGTQAHDAVTIRQLAGALSSFAVTGQLYFHANSAAADSLAVGAESIAVGPTTVVNGDNGVGVGNGAIVDATAPGGVAIGQAANSAQADAIAVGSGSVASGAQSIAQGANASAANAGSIAIGSGAQSTAIDALALGAGANATSANSVALGSGSQTGTATPTPSTTINGTVYGFAGTNPTSVVSVVRRAPSGRSRTSQRDVSTGRARTPSTARSCIRAIRRSTRSPPPSRDRRITSTSTTAAPRAATTTTTARRASTRWRRASERSRRARAAPRSARARRRATRTTWRSVQVRGPAPRRRPRARPSAAPCTALPARTRRAW
ncbi:Haemagluttinin domain protein [Paraburkholderia graminis C4D1M]|uniref:Haemagluttinin domain protein n=1 Tax=Paraburkholderia graminis (strain ATCC 700544 / DSM 17151 / LMG 18924 / NCIMB 13744 / C4D1M) TaxID=396598 RepID=B1G178_PARG4|nr:Haemagluttinin domain protein [Paraburkholderia graminis C4D1M]